MVIFSYRLIAAWHNEIQPKSIIPSRNYRIPLHRVPNFVFGFRGDVPRESGQRKELNEKETEVDLRGTQSEARVFRPRVVIIMPPFPEHDRAEIKVIPAIVLSVEKTISTDVTERIHEESEMVGKKSRNEVGPSEERPTPDGVENRALSEKENGNPAVEHPEFARPFAAEGIFTRERFRTGTAKKPADVGVVESVDSRRMRIADAVGISVVHAVAINPPARAPLAGETPEKCQDESDWARGLKGFVSEITVIANGDAETADRVEEESENYRRKRGSDG